MVSQVRISTWIGLSVLIMWFTALMYGVYSELGGDFRVLLHLGSMHPHPEVLQGAPIVQGHGADGQFFAALATDPLLLDPKTATMFDAPYYRASRIGLPLLAWLAVIGQPGPAILVYQILCWLLGALLTWVLARWLEDEGHSPFWAAPAALYGGVIASMYMSLPDAAMVTLMATALWHYSTRRRGVMSLLMFAALVKEPSLIAAAAVAIAEFRKRHIGRAFLLIALPTFIAFAWRGWVIIRLGFPTANAGQIVGQAQFDWPLAWVATKLMMSTSWMELVAIAGLGIALLGVVVIIPNIIKWGAAELCYAGFASMALLLSKHVYLPHWWNHSRVLLLLPALSVIIGERQQVAWRRWLFRSISIISATLGVPWLNRWAYAYAGVLVIIWVFCVSRHAAKPPNGSVQV